MAESHGKNHNSKDLQVRETMASREINNKLVTFMFKDSSFKILYLESPLALQCGTMFAHGRPLIFNGARARLSTFNFQRRARSNKPHLVYRARGGREASYIDVHGGGP